jgi:hypothetical protein
MSNKRDLKAFVRYDGSGRVVAGSLILRKQKPKVGRWTEIQGYECCNVDQTPVLVEIVNAFPIGASSFRISPDDGNFFQTMSLITSTLTNNVDELAALFNASFRNAGFFKVVAVSYTHLRAHETG